MTLFQKLTLGTAGLTGLGIGLAITFVPQAFYAGYGIEISPNPAAMSELRAPGANLAALGALVFAGAIRPGMARLSAALATLIYFAFALGRLVSIGLDGWPGDAILSVLGLEIVIGLLCLVTWRQITRSAASHQQGTMQPV